MYKYIYIYIEIYIRTFVGMSLFYAVKSVSLSELSLFSLISPTDWSHADKYTDIGGEMRQKESAVCSLVISKSVFEKGTY